MRYAVVWSVDALRALRRLREADPDRARQVRDAVNALTSGEQAARRAAVALAERLGIPVTYLPGGHGGWGSDPQEFADRLHKALQ